MTPNPKDIHIMTDRYIRADFVRPQSRRKTEGLYSAKNLVVSLQQRVANNSHTICIRCENMFTLILNQWPNDKHVNVYSLAKQY